MIMLKKNDKIIILIAVVVLIVAAIGIAAYNAPEDDNDSGTGGKTGDNTYMVTWETDTHDVSLSSDMYAGKSEPYTDEITITDMNIKKVIVNISWEDDSWYGILRAKGLDTLYAEIMVDEKSDSWESTGYGETEMMYSIHPMPPDGPLYADSMEDAEEILESEMYDDSITITLDVSVQTGEPIFRPLKYLGDQGNDFTIQIWYETYTHNIDGEMTETGGNDGDDPDEDDDPFHPSLYDLMKMIYQ